MSAGDSRHSVTLNSGRPHVVKKKTAAERKVQTQSKACTMELPEAIRWVTVVEKTTVSKSVCRCSAENRSRSIRTQALSHARICFSYCYRRRCLDAQRLSLVYTSELLFHFELLCRKWRIIGGLGFFSQVSEPSPYDGKQEQSLVNQEEIVAATRRERDRAIRESLSAAIGERLPSTAHRVPRANSSDCDIREQICWCR